MKLVCGITSERRVDRKKRRAAVGKNASNSLHGRSAQVSRPGQLTTGRASFGTAYAHYGPTNHAGGPEHVPRKTCC